MRKIVLLGFVLYAAAAAAAAQGRDAASVYYRDGVRFALEGRLSEAAAAFEAAVRLDPQEGDAYYSLGNVYSEQGRWAEAVEAYRQAVVLKKKDGEAYNGLGLALAGSGQYEQAVVAFRRAIEIFPAWAEPRFHLSQVYRRLGRDVAAQVTHAEALERRPDYAAHPPRSFDAAPVRTRVASRVERPAAPAVKTAAPAAAPAPRASDAAPRSTRPAPVTEISPYEQGLRHNQAGRYEEAVAALRQAVRLDRDNAGAFSALGRAYANLGRWREAVDAFEQAVRLDPKDANAFEMLGRSYAKLRETAPPSARADGADTAAGVRAATTSSASTDTTTPPEREAPVTPVTSPPVAREAAPARVDVSPGRVTSSPESSAPAATGEHDDPTSLYRVGPGDVLEVRAPGAQPSRATVHKVTPSGFIDHPRLGAPLKVGGLTTDEIAAQLGAELRRNGAAAQVSVEVQEYASHSIIVSGLVRDPGTKILRREGVPLYVIVAHAQPLPEAGQVLVVSQTTGGRSVVDLADDSEMSLLVRPGDVITVRARPQQFFYVAGAVRQPGQKEFHAGLTLTQALLAAGGVWPQEGAAFATVGRRGADGRLSTARYALKEIEAGKASDPVLQPGDRVEVFR